MSATSKHTVLHSLTALFALLLFAAVPSLARTPSGQESGGYHPHAPPTVQRAHERVLSCPELPAVLPIALAPATDVSNDAAAHGLRQYAADEALDTAGFEVQGISFNAACMSQGCWEMDVKYSLAAKAMSVLYLPRTDGDDALENGGGYPASVESTFEPKLFPCGLMGTGGTNACCIKELMQSYRTPAAFEAHMASVDFSLCPNVPLSSNVIGDLDAVSKYQFIQGDFAGMPESQVGFLKSCSPDLFCFNMLCDAGQFHKHVVPRSLRYRKDPFG